MDEQKLLASAQKVLDQNDRGSYTVPAGDLYPHQWLWDSCFIAIGLRHLDVGRAQTELESLTSGQWSNGMLPDMVFGKPGSAGLDELLWDSFMSPFSPPDVGTSGITQPPMMAEAVWRVGQKLPMPERRSWFNKMLPAIIHFHEWLYEERDPKNEGLVTLVHPYEAGLDNAPPWMDELHHHGIPWWVKLIDKLRLDLIVDLVRRDTRNTRPGQRMTNIEALSLFVAMRRLRKKSYDSAKILQKPDMAVQDLLYNCILIKANERLADIAKTAGVKLPAALTAKAELTKKALNLLWDEESGQYFCRSYASGELIAEPSIETFMPLYAGTVSKERAETLVQLLGKHRAYKLNWPVPSAPQTSAYFNPDRYWQGPTWVNTNWLIIEGLKNYGYLEETDELKSKTLRMVEKNGFCEYYNPHTAKGLGADTFSWSAALTIDLLKT